MSIGLVLQFKGIGADKYDAVMQEIGLTGNKGKWPDGIISHAAGKTKDGWCVFDVWQSQAHFDKFFAGRLKPAIDKVGFSEPQITPIQMHNTYKHG